VCTTVSVVMVYYGSRQCLSLEQVCENLKCVKFCISANVKCKLLVTVSVTSVKQGALGVLIVTVVFLVMKFWFIAQLRRLLEGLLQSVIVVKVECNVVCIFIVNFKDLVLACMTV